MASPDTIPCSCCDGEATHRGADGFYRCESHRLTADLAPFEVAVVADLRAQLAATKRADGLAAELAAAQAKLATAVGALKTAQRILAECGEDSMEVDDAIAAAEQGGA